jgi:7-cyano-7-deazaguanine synthase
MARDLAVVLVSGGMDSCVAAALARQTYDCAFLHVNYGQRTQERELRAFHAIADHYGVERRLVVSMEHLRAVRGSSLTDPSMPVPRADLERSGIPSSYVPFRNAGMLSVAVSWAEVIGAPAIVIGAVEEDSSGYPDCRRAFFDAFNVAIERGTRPGCAPVVQTPVISLSKRQIIQQGMDLGAPLHLTWSCYQSEDLACGTCDSCALRLRAFQSLGLDDPIPYRERPRYHPAVP